MFFYALLAADLGALILGALWLHQSPGAERLTVWRQLLRLAACCVGFSLAFLYAGVFLTASGFAALRALAHAIFCVGLPLCAWSGVQLWRARARRAAVVLIVLAIAGEGVYWWSRHIEPFDLQIDRMALSLPRRTPSDGTATTSSSATKPTNAAPLNLRIALIADLQTDHIGAYESEVFQKLDEAKADLVLFAGDYLQIPLTEPAVYEHERAALRTLLLNLRHQPRYGFYGVWGDIDSRNDVLEGSPVIMLEDAWAELPSEFPFQLYGLGLGASRRELEAHVLARIASEERATIVLGHAPDFLTPLIERGDSPWSFLALAGHVHGGQVVVPFFGPPITLSRVPRSAVDGSLQRIGRTSFVISRGLGMERGYAPRLRFACKPQLIILELTCEID